MISNCLHELCIYQQQQQNSFLFSWKHFKITVHFSLPLSPSVFLFICFVSFSFVSVVSPALAPLPECSLMLPNFVDISINLFGAVWKATYRSHRSNTAHTLKHTSYRDNAIFRVSQINKTVKPKLKDIQTITLMIINVFLLLYIQKKKKHQHRNSIRIGLRYIYFLCQIQGFSLTNCPL